MNRYIGFDVVKFLKESRGWEEEKKKLQEELDSITEIRGKDNSPVRSRRINDAVSSVAVARERIQNDIDRIEYYEHALDFAMRYITESEKEVIEMFFFGRGYISALVDKFSLKHAMCRSDVYSLRRQAIDHLSRIITKRFL